MSDTGSFSVEIPSPSSLYGTPGTLTGSTADITAGSNAVTFHGTAPDNGSYIQIADEPFAFTVSVSGMTGTLVRKASQTLSGKAVSYIQVPDLSAEAGYNINRVVTTEPAFQWNMESCFLDQDGYLKMEAYLAYTSEDETSPVVQRPFFVQINRDLKHIAYIYIRNGLDDASKVISNDFTTTLMKIFDPNNAGTKDLTLFGTERVAVGRDWDILPGVPPPEARFSVQGLTRIHANPSGFVAPTTGEGFEMNYSVGVGSLEAWDRGSNATTALQFLGNTITLRVGQPGSNSPVIAASFDSSLGFNKIDLLSRSQGIHHFLTFGTTFGTATAGARLKFVSNSANGEFSWENTSGDSFVITNGGNFGFNTTSFGTSASGVISIANGTAPTSSPTGVVQLWAEGGTLKGRSASGNVVTIVS